MFDADLSQSPNSQARNPAAGRDEVHVLVIAARSNRAALLAVEEALAASDADLCRMTLKPVGDIVEATLKLRGVDAATAQRLADRACEQLGVRSAQVEHLWALK